MTSKIVSPLLAVGLAIASTMTPFAGQSCALPIKSAPPSAQQAYQQLLATKIFAFGGIGIAGRISEGETAFRTVAASTNALELFTALLKNGTSEAQMYALCGIRRLAPGNFGAQAKPVLSVNRKVMTMQGCIGSEVSATNVVTQIASGAYDRYWVTLEHLFEVPAGSAEIELICELRESRGEAWFEAGSLRLTRR